MEEHQGQSDSYVFRPHLEIRLLILNIGFSVIYDVFSDSYNRNIPFAIIWPSVNIFYLCYSIYVDSTIIITYKKVKIIKQFMFITLNKQVFDVNDIELILIKKESNTFFTDKCFVLYEKSGKSHLIRVWNIPYESLDTMEIVDGVEVTMPNSMENLMVYFRKVGINAKMVPFPNIPH